MGLTNTDMQCQEDEELQCEAGPCLEGFAIGLMTLHD